MASRVPWLASHARKDPSCGCWPEFGCDHRRFPRLDEISSDRFCRMHRRCVGCFEAFCLRGKASEINRGTLQLPVVYQAGLHLGIRGRAARRLGCLYQQRTRHLGSITTCADSRISVHDGLCDRTTRAARLFGHESSVQHKADACRSGTSDSRLCLASQFGSSGLSGAGSFRLVVASGFGDHRDDCRDPVCYQSNPYLHQPKAVEQRAAILAELLRFLKSSERI